MNLLRVLAPPLLAAYFGAELLSFSSLYLNERFSALSAKLKLWHDARIVFSFDPCKVVSTAVSLHTVLCEPDGFSNGRVTIPSLPQRGNPLSLPVCHQISSSPRTVALTINWKKRGRPYKQTCEKSHFPA